MLRSFFERIIDWDDPDAPRRVPVLAGDIPKADEPLPKFLDDPTAAKFMAALAVEPNRRRRLIVELLARTGMRVGELGGLRDDAMYRLGDTWWLRIPIGKLHNDRTVPLHPMLVGLINDYRAWRGPTATGLLVERDDHQPMDPRTIYRHVTAVARHAGIAHVHPHALRHTLATQCINRGMSLEAIAALLGHRSPRMTLVYARISDTTVAEQYFTATNALEAGTDTARRRTTPRPHRRGSPAAARQRSLHPTGRARLPLPDHLRRLRLLPDRTRVHPHPAPPTRRRHRPRRPRPHPALQRADRRHRRHRRATTRETRPHDRLRAANGRSEPPGCGQSSPTEGLATPRHQSTDMLRWPRPSPRWITRVTALPGRGRRSRRARYRTRQSDIASRATRGGGAALPGCPSRRLAACSRAVP